MTSFTPQSHFLSGASIMTFVIVTYSAPSVNTCTKIRIVQSLTKPNDKISSSSSCRAACADIPDRLSPFLPIIHRLRQVFRVTSRVLTQLLYVGSCWSSHSCSSMCGGPQEYVAYELVLASPAVSCVSGSSNLYSFCDGGQVSV